MPENLRIRNWICVLAAFLACVYVWLFNEIEIGRYKFSNIHLIGVVQYFIMLKWWAFAVPVTGALLAMRTPSEQKLNRWWGMIPLFLGLFSASYCFLCVMVWALQQPPITAHPSLKL